MELRPAEIEDLTACAALPVTVTSSHVWQLTLARDPTASLATSEFSMTLRCLRLPRPVTLTPPGAPLQVAWERASAMFVAADEETVGGYVVLTDADERPAATVARLAVAPGLRRRGIGGALLRLAAGWAASEGLDALVGHCSARNHPAVAFYTRCGFTFAGYSEGYYARNEVALLWQRSV